MACWEGEKDDLSYTIHKGADNISISLHVWSAQKHQEQPAMQKTCDLIHDGLGMIKPDFSLHGCDIAVYTTMDDKTEDGFKLQTAHFNLLTWIQIA